MISTWVLIYMLAAYPYSPGYASGVGTIDNISSQSECVRVGNIILKEKESVFIKCIEVKKRS